MTAELALPLLLDYGFYHAAFARRVTKGNHNNGQSKLCRYKNGLVFSIQCSVFGKSNGNNSCNIGKSEGKSNNNN